MGFPETFSLTQVHVFWFCYNVRRLTEIKEGTANVIFIIYLKILPFNTIPSERVGLLRQ